MAKSRMLIPAWFRSAPLLLTMLALMAGIVGMHAWTGGLGATATAAAPAHEHAGVIQNDGGTIPPLETTSAVANHPLESDTDCSEGCGGMTMLNCVLAFALLILTVLIRPAILTLSRPMGLFRPIPLLLRTAAPVRGPSLVHLSISRT